MGAPASFPVAADVVLLAGGRGGDGPRGGRVLLIERGHEPYRGRLALPGGFVEPGETAEQGALRELAEETGISRLSVPIAQLGAYGPAGRRDPRGEIVSIAFLAILETPVEVVGGDDAASAQWVPVALALQPGRLAFDHERILADALERAS